MVQRKSSEASSGDREVTLRIDGAVAYVLFDRPWARNAMTLAIYDGLATACAAINENSRVRVAVLRGAGGKAFVAHQQRALRASCFAQVQRKRLSLEDRGAHLHPTAATELIKP